MISANPDKPKRNLRIAILGAIGFALGSLLVYVFMRGEAALPLGLAFPLLPASCLMLVAGFFGTRQKFWFSLGAATILAAIGFFAGIYSWYSLIRPNPELDRNLHRLFGINVSGVCALMGALLFGISTFCLAIGKKQGVENGPGKTPA